MSMGCSMPSTRIVEFHMPLGSSPIASSMARCDDVMMCSANSSKSVMAYSSIIEMRRAAPVSLQAASEWMSPMTCTGSRTLASMIATTFGSNTPSVANFRIGRYRPSWYTSFESVVNPAPPMSTTWLVQANSATSSPRRNAGVTTTMSNRWPVPFHGSLVRKMSPGRISDAG